MLQVAWVTRKQIQKYQFQAHSNNCPADNITILGFICIKYLDYMFEVCVVSKSQIRFNLGASGDRLFQMFRYSIDSGCVSVCDKDNTLYFENYTSQIFKLQRLPNFSHRINEVIVCKYQS